MTSSSLSNTNGKNNHDFSIDKNEDEDDDDENDCMGATAEEIPRSRDVEHPIIWDRILSIEAATTALLVPTDHDVRVACYCEENVWRLAYRKIRRKQEEQIQEEYFVVFISNDQKCVPMLHQRAAGSDPWRPCCWDYHVILLGVTLYSAASNEQQPQQVVMVYDVDSVLPYPCSLQQYLQQSFAATIAWPDIDEAPRFRLVRAAHYLQSFSSNRQHMYNVKTKKWNAPPPTYACIHPAVQSTNLPVRAITLQEYWDVSACNANNTSTLDHPRGIVLTLPNLSSFQFSRPQGNPLPLSQET